MDGTGLGRGIDIERQIVFGDRYISASLPDRTQLAPAGVSVPLEATDDLAATVQAALEGPLDRPPLRDQVQAGHKITIAFDDATVPCYVPLWNTALPLIVDELVAGGVAEKDISLVCANALHRRSTLDELARLLGAEVVKRHASHLRCHDAEDPDQIHDLGTTPSGYRVELNRCVTDADLTIYLNCSTTRGFSGGWKSICVGLSTYRSIHHHHTPDIMSMSLDRNRMHEMLDEMGALVEHELGAERIFKLETVMANPLAVHDVYSGSVDTERAKVVELLRRHQPPRRSALDEPVDVVVYGVPDWSPYAAFAHGNPLLDIISTGLGYLGGPIQAMGKPGCTVILATPCPERWDEVHHPSYREVWNDVIPETKDPDVARRRFEPELAARSDLIDKYRHGYGFHPVHAVMALYPLKRLRHAGRVIVAGAVDPTIPAHCGFDAADSVEQAIRIAEEIHGGDCSIALVDYPMAFNRA